MAEMNIFEMAARLRGLDARLCEAASDAEISSLVRERGALFAEFMKAAPKTGEEARALLRVVAHEMKSFELGSELLRPLLERLGNSPPFPAWELPGESGA